MGKAYTDIEQSKKLAEILPLKTADICFNISQRTNMPPLMTPYGKFKEFFNMEETPDFLIPCWSLAALLNIMPKHIKQNDGRTYKFHIFNDDGIVIQRWGCSYVANDYHNRAEYLSDPKLKYPTNIYGDKYEDILDACYEMILKLHEQKLL